MESATGTPGAGRFLVGLGGGTLVIYTSCDFGQNEIFNDSHLSPTEYDMKYFQWVVQRIRTTLNIARATLNGSETVDSITLYGRPEFRGAVKEALIRIRDKGLPAWSVLGARVETICEGTRTFTITTHPAVIMISRGHAEQCTADLAGTLAHQACFIGIRRRWLPRDQWASQEEIQGPIAQGQCMRAYRECIEALGGDTKCTPEKPPTTSEE